MDCSTDIPLGPFVVPHVQYDMDTSLLTNSHKNISDTEFLGSGRRYLGDKFETRAKREILQTLLVSPNTNAEDVLNKVMKENITYRDLASLTDLDLEMMGFGNSAERQELLECFKLLPNQDPTYDDLLQLPEANTFNTQILNKACAHLQIMHSVMLGAHYKAGLRPPTDMVLGEKYYASHFLVESLKELSKLSKDLEQDLLKLQEMKLKLENEVKMTKSRIKSEAFSLMLSAVGIAAVFGIWYMIYRK